MRRILQYITVFTVMSGAAACGGGPTTPSGQIAANVVSLSAVCPAQLIVGQTLFCYALANLKGGGITTPTAVWATSDGGIASFQPLGALKGIQAGQVTVTATFQGVQGSAVVTVVAQDALEASSGAEQGTFKAGSTVTMWLVGYYGVASAGSGQLSMQITDQADTVVAVNTPVTVSRGGDSYTMLTTFTIPDGTTQVCRSAVLKIGSVTLTSPATSSALRCVTVGS